MENLYNILIVKYGEIGVKGKNRYIFENKLIKNVKNILKPIGKFNVYKEYGRIYVDLDGYDYEEVIEEVRIDKSISNSKHPLKINSQLSKISLRKNSPSYYNDK